MKQMIEWHSVDEMLPDVSGLMPGEHEYVLVRYQYCDWCQGIDLGAGITMCGFEKICDGVAEWDKDDSFGLADTETITHWAYLPDANDGEFERKKRGGQQ